MKNLLILGGEGFIGRNCLEYFHKKGEYNITSTYFSKIKNERIEGVNYVKVDLRNENEVKNLLKDKQIVIQAAATTTGSKDVVNSPFVHVTDNAVMNSWVFREAHLNKVEHVIFFSCTVMYQSKNTKQKESDWTESERIYEKYFGVGNTKVYLEKMCEFYSSLGSTKFTAIRHSNVFGPYDKYDLDKCHVVPAFVNKIVNADKHLDVWGDGTAERDIIYIDDLVNFVDLVIEKQKNCYELLNCGYEKSFSIFELAQMIMEIENKSLEIQLNTSAPNIPTTVVLDCEKSKKLLGWEIKNDIREGLKKTINWYKKNYL